MKFVVMIHSNPVPWGHPTSDYLAAYQAVPDEQQAALGADFDALMAQLSASGELVGGEALADPAEATVLRWSSGERQATPGPYAQGREHLAGFFLIDVATRERAEQVAARFSGPGETVELRATVSGDG